MTFFKSGVKKSDILQLGVGLATLFVTSTFCLVGNRFRLTVVARGDDYPLHYKNGSVEIDQWRMYSRQCTSFAAFRLSSVNGFEIPPAYEMRMNGDIVQGESYRVDTKPELGLLLGRQKVIMGTWPGYQMCQGIRLRSKSITMVFEKSITVEKSRLVR